MPKIIKNKIANRMKMSAFGDGVIIDVIFIFLNKM
jgi:hypothetical protein